MLAPLLPPPCTARDPAATAGGGAYSAKANTSSSRLIYSPTSVTKHKPEDLFKQSPPSWRLLMPFQRFLYSQPHDNGGGR